MGLQYNYELCKRPNNYQDQCSHSWEPVEVFEFRQVFVIFMVSFLLQAVFKQVTEQMVEQCMASRLYKVKGVHHQLEKGFQLA